MNKNLLLRSLLIYSHTFNLYTIIYEITEDIDEWTTGLKKKKIPILLKDKKVNDRLEEINDKLKEVDDKFEEINDEFKVEKKLSSEYIEKLNETEIKISKMNEMVKEIKSRIRAKSEENAI